MVSFFIRAKHAEPLSPKQRAVVVFLLAGVLASMPLFAFVRPVYLPLAMQLACITALSWLLARVRRGSFAPFWLALLTTIVTSWFAIASLATKSTP